MHLAIQDAHLLNLNLFLNVHVTGITRTIILNILFPSKVQRRPQGARRIRPSRPRSSGSSRPHAEGPFRHRPFPRALGQGPHHAEGHARRWSNLGTRGQLVKTIS